MFNHSEFEDVSAEEMADPSTFSINDIVSKGAVFVIPVDAPIPAELSEADVPSGTLYRRLQPLCTEPAAAFSFVPVSGAELMHLDRAWRLLQVAKKVYVLMDLPGARYDVMFTQASRQIGLTRIEWPAVSEAIASKAITDQRTKDAQPWQLDQDLSSAPNGGRKVPKRMETDPDPLEEPAADED